MLAFSWVLAFGLELAALAAFGVWGAQTGPNLGVRVLLGVGAPLLVAIFWGAFLSPRAAFWLPPTLHWPLKLLVFAAAVGALAAGGQVGWALGYAGCSVLYLSLCRFLPSRDLTA